MPCLVAWPSFAHPGPGPGRYPHPKPRRARTVAALPCRCRCGRRHLLGASSVASLLPLLAPPSHAAPPTDPDAMLEKVHPARPDWYEKLYAIAMDKGTKSYEAEISEYKAKLFSQLTSSGKNILELGVGTGPNLKYYVNADVVSVVGVDPNKHMEEYAREAAVSAGLPLSNFSFRRGVGEALPAEDNSMDAVIGTLVLCSVSNVDMVLKEIKRVLRPGGLYLFIEHVAAPDGSLLQFVQRVFDPLQQFVADGCHLTRKTEDHIGKVGFSSLSLDTAHISSAFIMKPHVYGVACK